MDDLILILDDPDELELSMDADTEFELNLESASEYAYPIYSGRTTFTPTDEAQTISCGMKTVMTDITVMAIPESYGSVLYDNGVLTVS